MSQLKWVGALSEEEEGPNVTESKRPVHREDGRIRTRKSLFSPLATEINTFTTEH